MALLNTGRRGERRSLFFGRGWRRGMALLLLWTAWLLPEPLRAQAPAQMASPKEYQIKAAFLFNFVQFTEWPAAAFPDAGAPLVIGVFGDNPFGADLDAIVRGEKVNGRPLVVKYSRQAADMRNCHVVYVSPSESRRLDELLGSVRGRSVLTVGDGEDFNERGGMIRFATEKNKIRLRINLDAAKAVRLVMSSKLLRLADIVPGKG